jgi:hypothetical protein
VAATGDDPADGEHQAVESRVNAIVPTGPFLELSPSPPQQLSRFRPTAASRWFGPAIYIAAVQNDGSRRIFYVVAIMNAFTPAVAVPMSVSSPEIAECQDCDSQFDRCNSSATRVLFEGPHATEMQLRVVLRRILFGSSFML